MKKIVNLVFALVFLSEQIYATNLSDMVNTASTRSSEWDSPATGSKYFYSGSYEFSFKKSTGYAPWFNAGGSGDLFKAGCNGFSTGDMFISMLGLNDIKDQLSDAGAQLAWGVMIAMVMSMPGIHETFKAIQKWARAIQNLLQNACQIGQSLAKGGLFGPLTNTAGESTPDIGDKIHQADEGIAGTIDKMTKWVTDQNTKLGGSSSSSVQKAAQSSVGAAVKKIVREIQGTTGISAKIIASSIDDGKLPADSSTNSLYIGTLNDLFNSGSIGGYQIISNSDARKALKLKVLLNLMFVGDKAVSMGTVNQLKRLLSCFDSSPGQVCTVDTQKVANAAINSVSTGDNMKFKKKNANIPPMVTNYVKIAKAITYGFTKDTAAFTDGDTSDFCVDGFCVIDDHNVILADFTYSPAPVSSSDANATAPAPVDIVTRALSLTPESLTNTLLVLEWHGALKESYALIKYKIKQLDGYDGTIGVFSDDSVSPNADSIIPIVIPGAAKYFQTIATLEKIAHGETEYTASLKLLLARVNAYFFANSFFSSLIGKIESGMSASKAGGDDYNALAEEDKKIRAVQESVRKEFKQSMDDTENLKMLVDIFTQIDKNLRQDRSNMLR